MNLKDLQVTQNSTWAADFWDSFLND